MRCNAAFHVSLGLFLVAAAAGSTVAVAQAPGNNQPRLVVPNRGATIDTTTPPQQATPIAQPPGQPTTTSTSTPPPVTQVSGPPAGVTQLPNSTATTTTSSSSQAATASYRGYSGSKYGLSLDGIQAGAVNAVAGGTPTSEVVVEKVGADNIARKHIAGVKYEDVSFSSGLDSKPLNDWISATLTGQHVRKNGSVIAADYNYKAVSELQFFNGIITGIGFPALDGGSKDAASIAVTIAPEYTRSTAATGTTLKTDTKAAARKWLSSNFRFEMMGLDGSHVNHIDPITITAAVADHAVGETRDYEKQPAGLAIPNVILTMSESSAATWAGWLDDFLVKGNNSDDKERSGSIVYLDASMQKELGRLNLSGCGIYRLAPVKAPAGAESIRRVQAELYCERMEFDSKGGGA